MTDVVTEMAAAQRVAAGYHKALSDLGLPLGSTTPGIDVQSVQEVAESLATFGDRYLRRVHRPSEITDATMAPRRRAEHFAGRFAAKEAVVKALEVPSTIAWNWQMVEIISRQGQPPAVQLHGDVAVWARQRGVREVKVSITHDGDLAVAFALAHH